MKVLGFDSWTRGSHHYARLDQPLARRGITITLAHLGSWGNDTAQPVDFQVGSLRIRDIASYPDQSLPGILDHEQPDLVVFLSVETFAHRAFNRLCVQRGIPTVNLYHGVASVFYREDGGENANPTLRAALSVVVNKAVKTVVHTLPTYIGTLVMTRARPREWVRFAGDVGRLVLGRIAFVASDDARTTACCVYVEADVAHAVAKYRADSSTVHVVGNPDLSAFALPEELLGSALNDAPGGSDEIMYIETGFRLASAGGEAEYLQHLRATRDHLAAQGWRLSFKCKPSMFTETMAAGLEELGVDVVTNHQFVDRLRQCAAALVEFSSVALFPAFLGLPVFLVEYGMWSGTKFGTALTTYPRSLVLTDLGRFGMLLEAARHRLDSVAVDAWIRRNVGPLPASEMPERVARVLDDLARRSSIRGKTNATASRV